LFVDLLCVFYFVVDTFHSSASLLSLPLIFSRSCPWLGNCVGRRNYTEFWIFVHAVVALSLYGLAQVAWLAILMATGDSDGFLSQFVFWFALAEVPVLLGVFFSVGYLAFYHWRLAVEGVLTYEWIMAAPNVDHPERNPWLRRSLFARFARRLCGPRPPSALPAAVANPMRRSTVVVYL
jgi:DHHC palmitoyltransferase